MSSFLSYENEYDEIEIDNIFNKVIVKLINSEFRNKYNKFWKGHLNNRYDKLIQVEQFEPIIIQ